MSYDVSFEIVKLNDLDESILNEIKSNPSVYAIGLDTMCKLLTVELPIKNTNIAIKNILEFLRYVDILLSLKGKSVITLSQKVLIEHLSRNEYKSYMNLLKEIEVITEVPYEDGTFYNKEKHLSKKYRIHNQYLQQEVCIVIFGRKYSKIEYQIEGKYNSKLVNTIKNMDIDIKSAIQDEIKNKKDNNSLRSRLNRVLNLYSKRFISKGIKVNRVYHSFSNISKISRKHLHIKGNRFNNIDVRCCQPLLLCYHLIKNNMEIDEQYIYDCQVGILYENFITPELDRTSTKVELYKSIFFDFKPNSLIAKKFKSLYPNTYKSLEILDKDETKLACKLQNCEAEIFNDLVPVKSKYYYTLFDAIYFNNLEDMIDIIYKIKERFNVYGIKPTLTINDEPELDIEITELI